MKASELTGAALDYMVAKCEGFEPFTDGISWIIDHAGTYQQLPRYSTDWTQGGPLIEREGINLRLQAGTDKQPVAFVWVNHQPAHRQHGSTPLIAAMRCYVASKMGDEVEVPEELL